jgi:hypothetical protein
MAFFLLVIAAVIMVAAYRGTQPDLFAVLKDDFTGSGNFVYWALAVIIVVAVGSIPQLKRVSDAFLVLIVIVIVVRNYNKNDNLFEYFLDQIKEGTSGSNKGVTANLQSVLDIGVLDKGKSILNGVLQ